MAELKPLKRCPFCGGKADYYCEARTALFDTKQEAIDAWNKRS